MKPGTTIISDEFRSYSSLSSLGYCHITVNHSHSFIDPDTHANTNLIEGLWSHMRRYLPITGVKRHLIDEYISSFSVRLMGRQSFKQFLTDLTYFHKADVEENESSSASIHSDYSSEDSTCETDLYIGDDSAPCLGSICESSDESSGSLGAGDGDSASEYSESTH